MLAEKSGSPLLIEIYWAKVAAPGRNTSRNRI